MSRNTSDRKTAPAATREEGENKTQWVGNKFLLEEERTNGQSVSHSVGQSFCMFVYMYAHFYVCLSVCLLSFNMCVCMSAHLSVNQENLNS